MSAQADEVELLQARLKELQRELKVVTEYYETAKRVIENLRGDRDAREVEAKRKQVRDKKEKGDQDGSQSENTAV